MSPDKKTPDKRKKPSFEEALQRLEKIVTDIEDGKVSLEASIEKYAEGTELIGHCRNVLDAAEKRIQVLARKGQTLRDDGELDPDEV